MRRGQNEEEKMSHTGDRAIMKTLTLPEAAAFLQMNPESLRQRVKAGAIPGAKPGKCWVFVEEDLVAYLRSLYAANRQAVRVTEKEVKSCHSTAEVRTASGGCASRLPMDAEYAKLLGL